jgi:carbon storage regulator CsrA
MLVITRRMNESLAVGDDVTLTVVEVRGDKVRLAVSRPEDVPVHRKEVYDALYPAEPPPRTPEGMAFRQAILEEPDDEGIRLIFADWLQERGDPLGEFIRVQCRLAKLPPEDAARQGLAQQQRLLEDEHGALWRAYLPPVLRPATFERGFVEAAELTARQFLAHAEELFAAAPLRRLRVRPGNRVAALAASPYLARLARLDLSGVSLGDEAAVALAGSPFLVGLDTLNLADNRIGEAGARALAASPHLASLPLLDLSRNPVGEGGAGALRARFGERMRL